MQKMVLNPVRVSVSKSSSICLDWQRCDLTLLHSRHDTKLPPSAPLQKPCFQALSSRHWVPQILNMSQMLHSNTRRNLPCTKASQRLPGRGSVRQLADARGGLLLLYGPRTNENSKQHVVIRHLLLSGCLWLWLAVCASLGAGLCRKLESA